MSSEYVTIVNRVDRILEYTFDGRRFHLMPGENPRVDWRHVPYIKNQHPVRGSQDPVTLRTQYLVGVLGTKDPVTPIDETKITALELLDRSKLGNNLQEVVMIGKVIKVDRDGAAAVGISASNASHPGFEAN